jgi:L-ribulose-5-phosphate 3-epimerase
MISRIGFMQGRLSPMVDGRIQSFPWSHWQVEFLAAEKLGIHLMEWTLDQDQLHTNPLLTTSGQDEINRLCLRHGISIPSLTGDCFMQAPLWKAAGPSRKTLEYDFCKIAKGCAAVGMQMMVVPLVDNGRLENQSQEYDLVAFLQAKSQYLAGLGLKVVFESDFAPTELARFISRLDPALFGINYDIGNSAALGFSPAEEIAAYGSRIVNVHIKDRVLGGTTVPLGTGHARFDAVFSALAKVGYAGNYILQAARATDDDHAGALGRYRDMALVWLGRYAA